MKWTYKLAVMAAASVLCSAAVTSPAEAAVLSQQSVLSGEVVSVAAPGTAVKEGQVLVTVKSLAGPVPAVRATADGVVKTVQTAPGQTVSQGDVLVTLESK
ncbi:MAG TPA: hypothetical protein DCS74_02430 [Veillonellaceae bacterium]|jgi:biotin carboxyl carrier protein|nr:hypothetical protein [Veillonellaceae bacterium]